MQCAKARAKAMQCAKDWARGTLSARGAGKVMLSVHQLIRNAADPYTAHQAAGKR